MGGGAPSLEPVPLGLHARGGRSAAPTTEGPLTALPVRSHNPSATYIHGLTPSNAHPYRKRLLLRVLLLPPSAGCAISAPVSRRVRLLVLLVFALATAATAVATAQNGGSHKNASTKPAKTMPTPPKTQPGPPPVHHQTTSTTPRPLGNAPAIDDAKDRRELDAFIAARPELAPWRDLIWYSAHYSYSNVSARGLAGMLWCIDFRVAACNRAEDARARRLFGAG